MTDERRIADNRQEARQTEGKLASKNWRQKEGRLDSPHDIGVAGVTALAIRNQRPGGCFATHVLVRRVAGDSDAAQESGPFPSEVLI